MALLTVMEPREGRVAGTGEGGAAVGGTVAAGARGAVVGGAGAGASTSSSLDR